MNREQWLNAATTLLRTEVFDPKGHAVPETIRASVGFPSVRALSAKNARIGECWNPRASADEHAEILISPRIADDPANIVAVLAHELIHAMGIQKHGKDFKKVATSIGLEGRMTATKPGETLRAWCESAAKRIGPWPGAKLNASRRPVKKQTTRMLKVACPECGYTVRTSAKWAEVGLPTCPCGGMMKREG